MIICQSCGMPMKEDKDFGTNLDNSKNTEYCYFCYREGEFTNPYLTKREMMELVTNILKDKEKMTEEKAEKIAKSTIPNLKRWK